MKFQMSQPIEPTPFLGPDGNSMSPLKKMAVSSLLKAHAHEMHEKSWQHSEHLRASTVAGRYEEEPLHKARMGTNRPRVQCWIIRVHIIMTAANCSPAVASRRTKYDGDFWVPTLLDAQPLDLQYRHYYGT